MSREKVSQFTHQQVLDYWVPRLERAQLVWGSRGSGKVGPCWACGYRGRLQRAHIRALADGGRDVLPNIHLLCSACHRDSEVLQGRDYWRWFLGMSTPARGAITFFRWNPEAVLMALNLLTKHRPEMAVPAGKRVLERLGMQ